MPDSAADIWSRELMTSPDLRPLQYNGGSHTHRSRQGFHLKKLFGGSQGKILYFSARVLLPILLITSASMCVDAQASENEGPPPRLEVGPPLSIDICTAGTGDYIELTCRATGNPKPSYTWLKDGRELQESLGPNGSHKIPRWTPNRKRTTDLGSYQCIVRNHHGVALSNVSRVHATSDFTQPPSPRNPKSIQFIPGQSVLLACSDVSNNTLTLKRDDVRWYRNGVSLAEDLQPELQNKNSKYTVALNGSLVILTTNGSDSGAIYQCEITYKSCGNSVHQFAKASIYQLTIISSPTKTDTIEPTGLYRSSEALTVLEDSPFSIQCIFSNRISSGGETYEAPTISWFGPGNKEIHGSEIREGGRSLTVPRASSADQGQYKCMAKYTGSLAEMSMKVNVQIDEPPSLSHPLEDQHVEASSTVSMKCRATGRPQPLVTWFVNDTQVATENTALAVEDEGETLNIMDIQYSTSVACVIKNEHGEYVYNAHVFVIPKGENRSTKYQQLSTGLPLPRPTSDGDKYYDPVDAKSSSTSSSSLLSPSLSSSSSSASSSKIFLSPGGSKSDEKTYFPESTKRSDENPDGRTTTSLENNYSSEIMNSAESKQLLYVIMAAGAIVAVIVVTSLLICMICSFCSSCKARYYSVTDSHMPTVELKNVMPSERALLDEGRRAVGGVPDILPQLPNQGHFRGEVNGEQTDDDSELTKMNAVKKQLNKDEGFWLLNENFEVRKEQKWLEPSYKTEVEQNMINTELHKTRGPKNYTDKGKVSTSNYRSNSW